MIYSNKFKFPKTINEYCLLQFHSKLAIEICNFNIIFIRNFFSQNLNIDN